jgi:NADPH2:quinone reductase
MRAILADTTGGPDVLRLVDLPTPTPGPGQLRVRVVAAGVNFIDTYHRRGLYPRPMPIRFGVEGAGVVEAVGEGVTSAKPGDRVAWALGEGAYATHAIVDAARAVPVPDGLDEKQAAGALLQGMTAEFLATSTFPLKKGDTCVVHAAAGGVGLWLCQFARRAGATVIATVGSEEKAALAREAGADEVVLYRDADFGEVARRLTGGRGVDVVYDSVGRDTFDASLACLRPRGLMVLYGQASGPVPPFDPQILNQRGSLFLTRPTLHHYTATRDELVARAGAVLGGLSRGELTLRIGGTFPLADAAAAHRAIESRQTTGKLLLLP